MNCTTIPASQWIPMHACPTCHRTAIGGPTCAHCRPDAIESHAISADAAPTWEERLYEEGDAYLARTKPRIQRGTRERIKGPTAHQAGQ